MNGPWESYSTAFGSLIPELVIYMPVPGALAGEIATITVPLLNAQPRDYAKEMLNRIRYLQDTYIVPYQPGGVAPTSQAFSDAESFILKLPLNRTGIPVINVAADGEVNFNWTGKNTHIDLGFFGNGTYSYFGRGAGTEAIGENVAAKSDIPEDLLKIATNAA
jgi:hypothetical protein